MAYNVLAGGMLTGKYLDSPAAPDEPNPLQSLARTTSPRGRMDDISWGHLVAMFFCFWGGQLTKQSKTLMDGVFLP